MPGTLLSSGNIAGTKAQTVEDLPANAETWV